MASLSQPHFGLSVRVKPTLPKVGPWSPPRLSKIQSSSWRAKTPRIGVFLVSLERSKLASHWPFGHLQPKLWAKEGPGVKLAVWLPTTKGRESTSSWRPVIVCDMALESSWGELQHWFRPRSNRTWQSGDMSSQSPGTPTGTVSGLQLGSPGEKEPLGCSLGREL
jgi:hypothetical protein